MPIRLVCPSCSAALSVKDEYAGRAVRCPKCGGVIPGTASAAAPSASKPALPSPLPPVPQEPKAAQNPFEVVNETEEPKGERPAEPRTDSRTRGDERGERPARRDRGDDRNDEPVAKRSKRKSPDDDYDDRPVRKKRRRDDDYDDDGERPAGKKGRSKLPLILAIVFGSLILCCSGVSFGVYYVLQKAGDRVQEVANDLKNKADQAEKKRQQATDQHYGRGTGARV